MTATTEMIHYECLECGMTATMVYTPTAERAWVDHMAAHDRPWNWEAWRWGVVPLELEVTGR